MKIIDLSKSLYTGMKIYPGDPEVEIEVFHTIEKNTWELKKITLGSHTGTHVDVPSHMHEGYSNLDEISLDNFFGQAIVTKKTSDFKSNLGLFFIEEVGLELSDKIINAKPRFVGGNITEKLERALLKNNIITYTNLINLDQIPYDDIFMFYALPLKIKNGDGSPVRAIAIIEDK